MVTRMEGAQTPWSFTTWLDLFDRWQLFVAGVLAFLAALIVVGGTEWFARSNERREVDALRVSLAVEIRPPILPFEATQETTPKRGEPAEAAPGQSEQSSDEAARRAFTPLAPPLSAVAPRSTHGARRGEAAWRRRAWRGASARGCAA